MKKIKITINGMHCSSCAANTEKSIKKIPGVKEANVSLMTKKGILECESDVKDEELKKAVERAGYKIVNIEREWNINAKIINSCSLSLTKITEKVEKFN